MATPYDRAIGEYEGQRGADDAPMSDEHVAALLAAERGQESSAKIIRAQFRATSAVPPLQLVGPAEGLWAPLEPLTYAVGGIVPASSLTLLSGYSSSLKSWLALAMAFAKGSGRPWLDHAPFSTERGPVTFMEREAGLYEIRRRAHAIRRPTGVIEDPMLDVCSFPAGGNIFSRDFMGRLRDLAAIRDMIFLDTLVAFAAGVDENSAMMAEGLGACSEAIAGTKCALVVVAHEKKKSTGAGAGDVDPRERVRGSSAIFGAVDAVLSCQRSGPREPVRVEQIKARNGREADPFTVSMLDAEDGGIRFAVALDSDEQPIAPIDKGEELIRAVVEAVRANPRTSGAAVRNAVQKSKPRVLDALHVAQERGLLRNLGTDSEAQWVVTPKGGS